MSGYLFFSWDYLGNKLQTQPGNLEALTTDIQAIPGTTPPGG